jgi:hypothetical protein
MYESTARFVAKPEARRVDFPEDFREGHTVLPQVSGVKGKKAAGLERPVDIPEHLRSSLYLGEVSPVVDVIEQSDVYAARTERGSAGFRHVEALDISETFLPD